MIETIVSAILHFVEAFGYFGIFFMSMLESTFLPIPSEATLIPAGYLIYQGKMSAAPVFVFSLLGTMTGSLVNYGIAFRYGRALLVRYEKIFRMSEEKLLKMEKFFVRHGAVSIFIGRLIFGVRHYISFPAGLARMDLKSFCFFTCTGGGIWTIILLSLGYMAGGNEAFLARTVPLLKIALALAAALIVFAYIRKNKKRAQNII